MAKSIETENHLQHLEDLSQVTLGKVGRDRRVTAERLSSVELEIRLKRTKGKGVLNSINRVTDFDHFDII